MGIRNFEVDLYTISTEREKTNVQLTSVNTAIHTFVGKTSSSVKWPTPFTPVTTRVPMVNALGPAGLETVVGIGVLAIDSRVLTKVGELRILLLGVFGVDRFVAVADGLLTDCLIGPACDGCCWCC